jgi:enamine deaminase RidA (YjgF/YER057c/UK114 family)
LTIRGAIILLLAVAVAFPASAQKGKKKTDEPVTQTLPVLKDLPGAVAAETAHLVFHVSPLSNKGLLSQQVRDALKALLHDTHGAAIVKLRAFVAGSGDMRRVSTIVSETFADHKLALPAVSTIEVGALPLEGAQVVIESISEQKADDKKLLNPNGLAFLPAQHAGDASASLEQLAAAARNASVSAPDMLRVTCFLGSVDDAESARLAASRVFPSAAADFVQRLRVNAGSSADCEGVGRRSSGGMNAPKLVFTGSQMAFGDRDSDLSLAFERLEKTLNSLGASNSDVIFSEIYPLTRALEMKLPPSHSPATTLIVEGLPSPDASMAIEVVAALRN